jgi:hypothetical protein
MIRENEMTDAITITPGQRIGAWEILSVDPSGRRAACSCVCKTVRILSVAALHDGTASPSCGCQQLSPAQQQALRAEAEEQERQRDLKNWRPGGRS